MFIYQKLEQDDISFNLASTANKRNFYNRLLPFKLWGKNEQETKW